MIKEYSADNGTTLAPEVVPASEYFAHIPLGQLVASLTNPRTSFNPARLQELADSIKASGVHQPILVRPLPGARVLDTDRKVQYEIVAGERRFRACQMAGLASIPAMVRAMADGDVLEVQIIENLQRDDLTELEEVEGYERLMQHSTLTAEAVGAKIGKSRSYVYARLKLLDLCQEARTSLRDGTIDASRALLLARIPDHKLQIKALEQVAHKNYDGSPNLRYRSAALYVQREFMLRLDRARFDIADAKLLLDTPACKSCPKRTGHEPELFSDVDSADVCTDPPCYQAKEDAHAQDQLHKAQERGQTIISGREAKALMPNSWGGVEGYLRLDDPRDGPGNKPLRNLISKQLDMGEIKATLIANPHQEGELMAVLPAATVAELLKAQGYEDAASKIDGDIKGDAKAQATKEKEELKAKFEQGWRNELMKRSLNVLVENDGTIFTLDVLRHIARHYANLCNTDAAKQLCKLLDLGTVAPKQALLDLIAEHTQPEHLILLMIMQRDVGYTPWMPPDYSHNTGLLLVAKASGVDVETVKSDVKDAFKPKKPLVPTAPLAQPVITPDADANPKKAPAKPAALRKLKLSAQEAQSGIAEAMQGIEAGQVPCPAAPIGELAQGPEEGPQVNSQEPIQGTLPVGVIGIGQRVKVLANVDARHSKWIGKAGTVTAKMGDRAWDVTFRGRNGGLASFDVSELEVVS